MISLSEEKLLSLPQAAKFLPGRPHIATIYRLFRRGSHGIRLETVLVGGRRFTSVEALQRFVERVTAAADGQPAPQPVRTSTQRDRAIRSAEAELTAAGI